MRPHRREGSPRAAGHARIRRALFAAEQKAVAVDLDLIVDEDHAVDHAGWRWRQLAPKRQVLLDRLALVRLAVGLDRAATISTLVRVR